MSKGRSKRGDIVSQVKYSRPLQTALFILVLMIGSTAIYVLVPNYYVEVKETSASRTVYHNGTYDFRGEPFTGSGDEDLEQRVSYKLGSTWYDNSRMFILVGLLLGILVYSGTALFIIFGKRSELWPSLFISMGYIPPGLVLLGCFRQIGDHLAFYNLNSVYETLGLDFNISVMFPALYLVALMNILIMGSLWYLYQVQTRPTKKDIASKNLRNDYLNMQKLMLVVTIASILGIIFTPLLPWVTNSQRQIVGLEQEEVAYGYTQHQFYNIEKSESDFLSSEEIDYANLLLQKEESLFKPDENFTSTTRGEGSGGTRSSGAGPPGGLGSAPVMQIKGNTSAGAVTGIERDRTFNDISMRIFQISLMFWVCLLLSIGGLFGINLLRKRPTSKMGKHLINLSYLVFFAGLAVVVLHFIIIFDVAKLNTFYQDMGVATISYSWWYNFLPATVAILIMIISVVFAKRSFIKQRYF